MMNAVADRQNGIPCTGDCCLDPNKATLMRMTEPSGTQRNRALEALVWITGLALIIGLIIALAWSLVIGLVLVGFGVVMLIITLVTVAIVRGNQQS